MIKLLGEMYAQGVFSPSISLYSRDFFPTLFVFPSQGLAAISALFQNVFWLPLSRGPNASRGSNRVREGEGREKAGEKADRMRKLSNYEICIIYLDLGVAEKAHSRRRLGRQQLVDNFTAPRGKTREKCTLTWTKSFFFPFNSRYVSNFRKRQPGLG